MQISGSMLGHTVLVDIRLGGNERIDRLPMIVTDHQPGGILSGHLFLPGDPRSRYMQDLPPAELDDRGTACWYPLPDVTVSFDAPEPLPVETPAEQAGNGAVMDHGEEDDVEPTDDEREHAEAHTEEHGHAPWEAYGHSRSWYYRHRREGTLPPLPSQEQQDEFRQQRTEADKHREDQE